MATLTTFTANTQIKSAEVNGNFTGLSDGTMDIDHNSLQVFRDEALFDFVNSGGVWTADSAGVNRNASMTALATTIDGWRSLIGAVTSRTFTASKDTYIDVLRTTTTTALVYTEVSNNAASPALASNSLRLGIIVTGATTIAAAGSINQGQHDIVLPIASSIPYAVTDSLGNLICPRDPNSKLLGYRQAISAQVINSVALTDVTALNVTVKVPANRKVKITALVYSLSGGGTGASQVRVKESSTDVAIGAVWVGNTVNAFSTPAECLIDPSVGTHTYKTQVTLPSTTSQAYSDNAGFVAFLKVELE